MINGHCVRLVIPAAFGLLFLAATVVRAQTFYLDTNGDGLNSYIEFGNGGTAPWDCLTEQSTSVDVYLVTDKNPDGTAATCSGSAEPLTISSYQVLLRSIGQGVLLVTGWTDNMGFATPSITSGDGTLATSGSDTWVGRSGDSLAPGTYRLGTLSITVTGTPSLVFVTSSTISFEALTGFGSACDGVYPDGRLLLGEDMPTSNAFPTCVSDAVISTTWGKIKHQYK